ncbi:replication-relaxation family protein [Kitasatospora sp. NPDC002227]|uniref:replication-relaxation family protein n=1 Tax=Kitasatospora sp. NPDC002227 TaxID=3154773 RepID=UPI00331E7CEB
MNDVEHTTAPGPDRTSAPSAGGAEPLDKGRGQSPLARVAPRVTTGTAPLAAAGGSGAGHSGGGRGRTGGDSPSPEPGTGPSGSARRIRAQVLEVLAVVRVARSEDLRQVLTPGSVTTRYVRRALLDLLTAGLVGRAQGGRQGFVWHLTRAGLAAVDAAGDKLDIRPRESTGAKVARSGVVDHALAVTATVTAMASHGVGGVRDWQLERAHSFDRGRTLITDLVLQAPHLTPPLELLVEVDRDTMRSAAMARKVQLYADYAGSRFRIGERGTQGDSKAYWRTVYRRDQFPPLLVVVDDVDQAGLIRRARLLHKVAGQVEQSRWRGCQLNIAVTSLQLLAERGPHEPVWLRIGPDHSGERAGLADLAGR